MTTRFEIPDHASAAMLWDYYERAGEALTHTYEQVRASLNDAGASLPARLERAYEGMTARDVDDVFRRLREELDRQTVLALTACFEAMLRIDYITRSRRRRPKNDPDRALYRLWKNHKVRVNLERIVEVWKEMFSEKRRAGDFKALLRFRHWVAHGRYWTHHGIAPPPAEAWRIAADFFEGIPTITLERVDTDVADASGPVASETTEPSESLVPA